MQGILEDKIKILVKRVRVMDVNNANGGNVTLLHE